MDGAAVPRPPSTARGIIYLRDAKDGAAVPRSPSTARGRVSDGIQ
jgi:hypothetical protein